MYSERQQRILVAWIKYNFIPTKSLNYRLDLDDIKLYFEKDPNGFPLTAEAFIEAMKAAGFRTWLEDSDYCKFNISKKSPAFL